MSPLKGVYSSAAGEVADGGDSGSGSAAVVDPAPPGQATTSVDGIDYVLDLPGGLECSIGDDAITFSFRIGDNEVVVGGGLNRADGGWVGAINLRVANPTAEPGPISYFTTAGDDGIIDGSRVAVDGASMSYTGPMQKQPANDGSNPPPVEVGTGAISATCG